MVAALDSVRREDTVEHATNWIRLWRDLAEMQAGRWQAKNRARAGRETDPWHNRARSYDAGMKRR
jgi:hypothetical protein